MESRRAFTLVVTFMCGGFLFHSVAVPFTKTQGTLHGQDNDGADGPLWKARAHRRILPYIRHEGQTVKDLSGRIFHQSVSHPDDDATKREKDMVRRLNDDISDKDVETVDDLGNGIHSNKHIEEETPDGKEPLLHFLQEPAFQPVSQSSLDLSCMCGFMKRIAVMSQCTVTNRSADCSCCGLKEVPKLSRAEMIVELNLSCNSLPDDSLHENVFAHFSNLKFLDLSSNAITRLPEGVFNGLSQLQYLNLKWNHILMNQQLNKSNVFQPLISLQTLILNKNNNISLSSPHLVYPEYALSFLGNLSELHLDGLADKSFGELFSKLTGLRNLQLAGWREGNCNLSSLYNNTFQYVSAITQLNIADCHLNKDFLHWGAFSPLVNLASLDISNNFGLSLKVSGELMYGLRNNKNFRHLRMQRIVTRFSPCVVVYKEYLKYFEEMGLETLDASYNEIVMIEEGALQLLPRTLKRINLMGNIIMFGAYLSDLDSLTNLKELNADGSFGKVENFPKTLPSGDIKCGENQKREEGKRKYSVSEPSPDGSLHLSLPPELKTLSMKFTNLAYVVGAISFSRNNSLEEAYLQGNVLGILHGPITGLEMLVKLDLSACFIENMNPTFFQSFPSLQRLNLSKNLLGESLARDEMCKTFNSMEKLTHLDISFNNIYHLHKCTFCGIPNLQTLNISLNRLRELQFDISQMKNLTSLIVSQNNLPFLDESVMRHIDGILNSNRSFKLDLRFNPISCKCNQLRFMEWLFANQNILIGSLSEYVCLFSDRPSQRMSKGFEETLVTLQRQCGDNHWLFAIVSCGTAVTLVILLLTIAYRFRWALRYWYHTIKLMTSSKRETVADTFDFDAFICYAHTDEDFVVETMQPELSTQRGVNLMIHGQSFRAGRLIIDNILMAVRRCRKTIVVVTKSMLESKWCLYELQMARMESINTGRSVLIFVFLENIAYKDIKHDIVSYIRTNSVTAYPPGQRQRKVFWDKLAHDIKDVRK